MTKRILAILLSVTMMITFLPVATFAGGSPVRIAATPGAGLISTGEGEPSTSVDSPWYDGGDRDGDITFSIADGDNGTSVLTLDYYNPREVREVTEVYTAIPQEGFVFDGWTYSYWDADDELKTQALTDGTVLAKENAAFLKGPIMANFKAEVITIADILPADFPTDDYDPWYNSENDDVCLYLDADNSKLVFDNTPFSDGVLISSVLSKAEKDPTWADTTTCRLVYSTDDIVVQFNMTGDAGDELENIVVTHCVFSGVEGTYEPEECELYAITNAAPEGDKETNHGYITIDKETAEEDETVTVTVKPNEGYQLKSLKFNDGSDHDITKDETSGTYQFTMPGADVTVTAEFEIPSDPGTEGNPWNVGTTGHESDVTAYVKDGELFIEGKGEIGGFSGIEGFNAGEISVITVKSGTVTGAVENAFAGFESFLTLPDGWQGKMPDDRGLWYGATVELLAFPNTVRNVTAMQRYPWNGKVDITAEAIGSDERTISVLIYEKVEGEWQQITSPSLMGVGAVDFGYGESLTLSLVWNAPDDLSDDTSEVYVVVQMDGTVSATSEVFTVDNRTTVVLPEGKTNIPGVTWSDTLWGTMPASGVTLGWRNTDGDTDVLAEDLTGTDIGGCLLPTKNGTYYLTHSNGDLTSFVTFVVSGFYTITDNTPPDLNCWIDMGRSTAAAGDTVTVSVSMTSSYKLASLKYNDGTDHEITKDATTGEYQFTMPAANVTVTAEFEKISHTHTFTYAASDNVLTATCEEGCDDGFDENPLTLTLTAPASLAYDGNDKAFTFAAGEADAWTDAGLELPDIIYCIKQSGQSKYLPLFGTLKFVGDYMAQITVDEKTAQEKFAITKGTPYIKTTPAPNEIEYGETLADSTLFGGYVQVSSTDSTQVGGLFEWTEPDTVPGVADSNVTLYSVTFTPGDEDNYTTVSCQVTVTVNHTHSPVLVKGQEPTDVAGFKDYYECVCGAYYEDAAGSVAIPDLAAWKAEGGNGYIAPVTYTVTYFDGDPVEPGPDTYEEKADGIHVYTFDLVFTGKTDKDLIMESACDEIYLEEMTVGGDLLSNKSENSVIVNMTDSTIEGDFRATKGEEEMYPCVYLNGDNAIKGDVVSDTTFTVYGEAGATLQVASVTTEDYLLLQNTRLENANEDYVFGESTTLTPKDTSLPITFTIKANAVFEDEETFVINDGKPFAFGEDIEIGTPVVFDENGVALDPQPELEIVYYAMEEEDYSFMLVDGVPTEEGDYCVAFFVSEDDPIYCGAGSYFFSIGHNIQKVTGKPATLTEDGYKDYYYCEGCDTYYEDEAGETPIDDLDAWKAEGGAGYLAVLQEIDTIVINGFCDPVSGGKVGDYLNILVPEDAHYGFLGNGMHWYDDAADNFIYDAEALFKDGKMYSIGGELVADEGYVFAANPKILLNGGDYPVDMDHSFTYSTNPRYFKLWTKSKKATAPIEPIETVVDLRIGNTEFYGVEGNQTLIVDSLDDLQDITVLTQNGLDIEGMSEDWSMSTKFLDSEGRGVLEVQVFETGDDYVTFNLQSHYADCPGANVQDFQIMMITAKLPAVEKLLGDANDDGLVNMKDVLTLRKMLADVEIAYNALNADCNEDGEVNMKDVLMLRQLFAGIIEKLGA